MFTVADVLNHKNPKPKAVKWLGETTCNFCGCSIATSEGYTGKFFYDARTRHRGMWALMCEADYMMEGDGKIEYGTGQKYDSTTGELVAGGQ